MPNPTLDLTSSQTTNPTIALKQQIALVQESWAKVKPAASEMATLFYQNLFMLDHDLRALFKGDMREQGTRLMQMLDLAVLKLDQLDQLTLVLQKMGREHAGYGVKPAHYDLVGLALQQTLEQELGHGFTPEMRAAWSGIYRLMADTMITAASSDDRVAP